MRAMGQTNEKWLCCAGEDGFEQIEKGAVPHPRSGKQEEFANGDEVGKLE